MRKPRRIRGIDFWKGENVSIVVEIGSATIRLEGELIDISKDWVTIKTKEGLKTIAKGFIILIEKKTNQKQAYPLGI